MFEECFVQQRAGETASPDSTPLRLGDIQDPVPATPARNELNQLTSNATLALLGGRFGYAVFVQDASVSKGTAKALQGSARDLRHTILHGALTQSENGLAKLGWQRHVTPDVSLWAVPEHRVLLRKNSAEVGSSIHGSARVPSANLWRNADGSIFYANPVGNPAQYSRRYYLHSHDITSAQTNGAFTVRESGLFKRLTLAEGEMQKLAALEQHANKSLYSSAMIASSSGLRELHLTRTVAYQRHEALLGTARTELSASQDALRANRNYALSGMGALLSASVINDRLDATVFKDAPTSTRTQIVDGLTPLAAFAKIHWTAKAATIIGAHLTSRSYDVPDMK